MFDSRVFNERLQFNDDLKVKISVSLKMKREWPVATRSVALTKINNKEALKQTREKEELEKKLKKKEVKFSIVDDCRCKYLKKWIPSIIVYHESSTIKENSQIIRRQVFLLSLERRLEKLTQTTQPAKKNEK